MAFRIAVSGLRAATADLDVTGNNIANGNTTGFKSSRAQFADLYAASGLGTTQDAIGQGVQLAAVAQQFTQGNVSFTDNSLDIAINGEGFFVVEDNNGRAYARAGAVREVPVSSSVRIAGAGCRRARSSASSPSPVSFALISCLLFPLPGYILIGMITHL